MTDDPGSGKAHEEGARRAAILVALYALVAIVGALNHEMWRDEWQAWMLARDSASLLDLLARIRFEGHPPGWYLPLFLMSKFTRDPLAMQLFHAAVATASVYLLARFAPLPWIQKVLLTFGYFLAYEYAIIARPYALGVLALFSFCALYPVRRRHPVLLFLTLVLLAGTTVYGLILSVAAAGMLLVEAATSPPEEPPHWMRRRAAQVGLVAWLVLGVLVVVWVIPPGGLRSVPGHMSVSFSKWSLATTASSITRAYLPFPDLSTAHFWGSHFLMDGSRAGLAASLIAALVLCAGCVLLFLPKPAVLFLYAVGTGGLLFFHHFVFAGFLRHQGQLFLLLILCLWLSCLPAFEWRLPPRLARLSDTGRWWGPPFVLAILSVQLVAGVILYSADLRRPFSIASRVAGFVQEQGLDSLPMAASPSPPASSIAGALDHPIHYFGIDAPGTFVPWRRFVRARDRVFSMERLRPFLQGAEGPVLLFLGSAFDGWDADLRVEELARFPAGLEGSEKFFLYRVGLREP